MQVVVLAGGVGSRLLPWTNQIPKPLLPMLDKTLLEQVISSVPNEMIDEVIVAGGYKVDVIKSYFSNSEFDFEIRTAPGSISEANISVDDSLIFFKAEA